MNIIAPAIKAFFVLGTLLFFFYSVYTASIEKQNLMSFSEARKLLPAFIFQQKKTHIIIHDENGDLPTK